MAGRELEGGPARVGPAAELVAARPGRSTWRPYGPVLGGAVLLVVLGVIGMTSAAVADVIAFAVVWALMAIGWNIISGLAGPMSLGQGLFFGVTSFTATILFEAHGLTPYVGIAIGVVGSALLALVIGLATLRLSGFYFALATLTIPITVGIFSRYLGYYQVLRPYHGESVAYFQFGDEMVYYWVGAVLAVAGMALTAWLLQRRVGRYFVAIRENQHAAEAAGVPVFRYKLYAFVIAAVIAALAGGLYSQLAFVWTPDDVYSPLVSIKALLMTLLGGAGTVLGPVIGAFVVVSASEITSTYTSEPGLDGVIFGALLVLLALRNPGGIYPLLASLGWRLLAQRRRLARRSSP